LLTISVTGINFLNSSGNLKYAYATIILLIIFFAVLYFYNSICFYKLSFGETDVCSLTRYSDLFNKSFIFDSIKFVENCGFSKLVDFYRSNPKITYVSSNVIKVCYENVYPHIQVYTNSSDYLFDKIIIACPYDSYSKIMNLDQDENIILSNLRYFDFYSTLVKFANKNQNPNNIDGVIGAHQQDDAYLCASHKPLDIKYQTVFKKQYKWKMPIYTDVDQKQLINLLPNRKTYFIGKEVTINGVNYCMEYAKKIAQLITT
jgi:hypothetical protein